jgi:hypothetical protein
VLTVHLCLPACAQVRNFILALWRSDVTQHLSEEAAAARVPAQHRQLASAAWRFLDREGYINWGVAAAITDRPVPERPEIVLVIGSGLAGACEQLELQHACVLVVAVVWGGGTLQQQQQQQLLLGRAAHLCSRQQAYARAAAAPVIE